MRLELLDELKKAQILRHLPLGTLDRLASRSRIRRLAAGELLMEEGQAGDSIHLVVNGRLIILKQGAEGAPEPLASRGPGDWIGEMALVNPGQRRFASVRCEVASRVLEVPFDAFLEVVHESKESTLDLLRISVERLRESDHRLVEELEKSNAALVATNRALRSEQRELQGELQRRDGFDVFVGASRSARNARDAAQRASHSDAPVLLLGESGTGKEVLARGIHQASERADARFVALNCSVLTESLLESTLFGHARGAFTNATTDRRGLVEHADGGTLFLDEVADMALPMQGALLRFLESGEYRRVGETRERRANVRIIAATNGDIDLKAREGAFRADLLYRLDVLRIDVAPLRERREDIPMLVAHLAEAAAERLGRPALRIEGQALETLTQHEFKGNVRELQNEIERLYAALAPGEVPKLQHLSPRFRRGDAASIQNYSEAVRAFKVRLVRKALEDADGNRTVAAGNLGVHRSNLVRLIRELDIRDAPAPPSRRRRPDRADRQTAAVERGGD